MIITLKSLLFEGHYPVVVGIVTMDGDIKSQETDKTHGDLNYKRGSCWRYNPNRKTVYWHGDSSEHDESDEINVDAHLYKKYGYSVKKNITLGDIEDVDSYNNQHDDAHGLYESIDRNEQEIERFRLSLLKKYPQLDDLYFYISSDNSLYLSSIRVKLEDRHIGVGKSVMRDIKKFADDRDLVITLSPEPEKTKYTKKLDDFYKDLGFVNNKGRKQDYRLGGAFGRIMYRRPRLNEGVIKINPEDEKDISKYVNDMDSIIKQHFQKVQYTSMIDPFIENMNRVSDGLKSNKFPFHIKYVFFGDKRRGWYEHDTNTIVLVVSQASEWTWSQSDTSKYARTTYKIYGVDFSKIENILIHEFVHYIQDVYRTEKSGNYTIPQDWESPKKYYKWGWEQQAHALQYLKQLKQELNIKKPEEILQKLKQTGLARSVNLDKLKQSDYKSWKAIMKQAIMATIADIEDNKKV